MYSPGGGTVLDGELRSLIAFRSILNVGLCMLWLVLIVCSRSTAVDLLSSRRARDGRRQHIQHQLDSLRFYDSVPLYDGLRRFTPGTAAVTASNPAADQDNPRGDSVSYTHLTLPTILRV